MYEKISNDCEAVRETCSPLSMGLMIKLENLSTLREILLSLSYSCTNLGIKDDYLAKEDAQLKRDEDITFIDRDERIYEEQKKVLSRIEDLTKQLSEFSNI